MRTVGVWILGAIAMIASDATATVTLTASRSDVLYSTDVENVKCGELAALADADLPYNIVRIRAEDDTGQATSFRWKLPKPNVGYFLRDDPTIGSTGGAFLVQAFCAEVGSRCFLDEATIDSYRRPTILWAAPTCDVLPKKTNQQFDGDDVKIRVKADGLRGRGSKASMTVGYGRLGTPVLTVENTKLEPDDGLGKKEIATFLITTFGVSLPPAIAPPVPIESYTFDNGESESATVTDCRFSGATPDAPACVALEYGSIGPFRPTVEVTLEDGSAYCDAATTRVVTCQPKTKLEVKRSPNRATYPSADGELEEVTVTLRNLAPRNTGCDFRFERLTCETAITKKSLSESDSIQFEPARCENAPLLFCVNDFDCGIDGPCVNRSHCSETTDRLCTADTDCSQTACPFCEPDETCTRVIQVPSIILPGQSAQILSESLDVSSVIPGKVKVEETWSITERFGRGDATTTDRFKIRGDPLP